MTKALLSLHRTSAKSCRLLSQQNVQTRFSALSYLFCSLLFIVTYTLDTKALAASSGNEPMSQPELMIKTNAAMCAQCHGTFGVSQASSTIASLAAMPREELIQKMQAYKLATPTSSVMARLARGITEEQINSLAIFFESQPRQSTLKN